MRWSPSYRLIVVLRAEASIVRVALNENETINHRKTQQTKFAKEVKFIKQRLAVTLVAILRAG
jgi:hypothetical protein